MKAEYRHLIFRSTLLCIFLSSLGMAQQPERDRKISSEVKSLSIDKYITDVDAISAFKSKRLKQLDPRAFLSREQHENLWENNIELQMVFDPLKASDTAGGEKDVRSSSKTSDRVRLDRIGMGATALISESLPTLCAEVMELTNEEVVGVGLDSEALESLLLKLKKLVDEKWVRSAPAEYPKLLFRAELVDHFSVIRKKHERWLLIDAYHVGEFEGDLVEAHFRNKQMRVVSGRVDSSDPRTYLTRSLPHPAVEESFHTMANPPKLLPNRADPKVIVHDDGLTSREREKSRGFSVVDTTSRNRHQIEGFSTADRANEPRLQRAIDEALDLLLDRIPRGSELSFEEFHLRIGSVANVMGRTLPDCQLVVTISDKKVGDKNYSLIKIDASSR